MAERELTLKNEGKKFGRYCSVEVRNFITGQKHTIGNDFNITFEFFKTIDEVDNASTGTIRIVGVTKETFDIMKSDGGEVSLSVGYVNTEIDLLFVAAITRMYLVVENGTLVTVIECSANVMNYHFSKGTGFRFVSLNDVSLYELMWRLAKSSGANAEISYDNVPEQSLSQIEEFLKTKSYNLYVEGNDLKSSFRLSIKSCGIDVTTFYREGVLIYSYSLTQDFMVYAMGHISEGYEKIKKKSGNISSGNTKETNQVMMTNIYQTSKELESKATVLSWSTGLISVTPEFKIATVLETKALSANESLTEKSKEAIANRVEAKQKREAKNREMVASGKEPLKAKQDKVRTVRVNREYVRIRALMDINVKPQSHILLLSKLHNEARIYRTRNVLYKGNNQTGEFTIDAYCEDSGGRYDSVATNQDIATRQSIDNTPKTDLSALGVDGELGDDTSYGDE